MKAFSVWISRMDGASGLRVDGLENANWLLVSAERFLRVQDQRATTRSTEFVGLHVSRGAQFTDVWSPGLRNCWLESRK